MDDLMARCRACRSQFVRLDMPSTICLPCRAGDPYGPNVTRDELEAALHLAIQIAREGFSRGWDDLDRRDMTAPLDDLEMMLPEELRKEEQG